MGRVEEDELPGVADTRTVEAEQKPDGPAVVEWATEAPGSKSGPPAAPVPVVGAMDTPNGPSFMLVETLDGLEHGEELAEASIFVGHEVNHVIRVTSYTRVSPLRRNKFPWFVL
jgi:hypothetical protein